MTAPETVTVTGTVSTDDADVDSDLAATENKRYFLVLCCVFVVLNKACVLYHCDLFRFIDYFTDSMQTLFLDDFNGALLLVVKINKFAANL